MRVIHSVRQTTPDYPQFMFFCPGCRCGHWFKTTGGRPRWTWNGDFERPTILPSILVDVPAHGDTPRLVCHSFVESGNIRFLSDSTHELRGQTVPLEEF
jgi:hypothetical protein